MLVQSGVFAMPPVVNDDWGGWMSATLAHPGNVLSHRCASAGWQLLSWRGPLTVTRPGNGGPRRCGRVVVHRSTTLAGNTTVLCGIPITSAPRTLLDVAPVVTERALARAVREAVRLELATLYTLGDALASAPGRRGTTRLASVLARYAGLPLERARSGAEVRSLEILRDAGCELPSLNEWRNGEEADLSWSRWSLIIEIDGGPFHLDVGEDARKQRVWELAGWTVRRISADDVYADPRRLISLLRQPNVQ